MATVGAIQRKGTTFVLIPTLVDSLCQADQIPGRGGVVQ